jgi:hypothetical protein
MCSLVLLFPRDILICKIIYHLIAQGTQMVCSVVIINLWQLINLIHQ